VLLPELFALLSSDLFLLLSLLTCLLEERFPKAVPYIYQVAALMGFGQLAVSKMFLTVFDVDLRFWYNFFYLAVGLANVVAVNLYLAVSKKTWILAKVWSASVTFPTVFISIFFIYNYGYLQGATFPMLTVDLILILAVVILGIAVAVLLSPKLLRRR
jgi:hypothetical protein